MPKAPDTYSIPADSLDYLRRLEAEWDRHRADVCLELLAGTGSGPETRQAQVAALETVQALEAAWIRFRDTAESHWRTIVQCAYSTGRVIGGQEVAITDPVAAPDQPELLH